MMVRENRDIKPLMFKLGVALVISFAGFFYTRFRIKRIKPPPPPPKSPCSSEHSNGIDSGGGRSGYRYEIHASQTTPSCSHILSLVSEKHEDTSIPRAVIDNISPSSRISPRKHVDNMLRSADSEIPKAFISSEKSDYEQEIKHLRNMVRSLRERERNLEVQLLEYYGLEEQETMFMELQNRLKLHNMETKLSNLKIESLQWDNRRLEAQVTDYAKVVSEHEAAKERIKILQKKLRFEAEQILAIKKRVQNIPDQESNIQINIPRFKELETQAEELKISNKRLQLENSELAERLSSIWDDSEAEALKQLNNRLRKENEDFAKEIERLQEDRCADVEELVYLRWLNACLRYELRNYQPIPGKAVARDLSKTLSPKSEEKAKQLILKYANTEGAGDYDSEWSYSPASGECDDSSVDNSSAHKTNKTKFFTKLTRLVRGKDHHRHNHSPSVDKYDSSDSPNFSSSVGDGQSTRFTTPTRNFFDIQKVRRVSMEDGASIQRNSDVGSSSFCYRRVGMGGEVITDQDPDSSQKAELVKYAEVLRHSRSGNSALHEKSKSFSSC